MSFAMGLFRSVLVVLLFGVFSAQVFAQDVEKKSAPVELSGSIEAITAASCTPRSWTQTGYSMGSCGDCWAKMTTRNTYNRSCYRDSNCNVFCSSWKHVKSQCVNTCNSYANPPVE